MKKNNKGFTLIELLAVIVILAIIALIATPIVLNMISNARKSAARSSALGYVDSINSYIPLAESAADLEINDDDYYDTTGSDRAAVKVPSVTCSKDSSGWTGNGCADFYAKVDKKTKGKKPVAASITIGDDKQVTMSTVSLTMDGGYVCTYDAETTLKCTKSNS